MIVALQNYDKVLRFAMLFKEFITFNNFVFIHIKKST